MLKHLQILYHRKFNLVRDPLINFAVSTLILLLITVLLVFTNLIINNFLFLLISNFLMFQYNSPLISDTLKSEKSLHFGYSKQVMYRYISFIYIKENPFILVGITFNILMLIFYIGEPQSFLYVILNIAIYASILLSKLMDNLILKYFLFFLNITAIISNILLVNKLLTISFIIIINLISFKLVKTNTMSPYFLDSNKRNMHTSLENVTLIKNKYIRLFLIYILRMPLKNFVVLIFFSLIYAAVSLKFDINIDLSSYLLFMYLFDLELVADQQFTEIERTSARYFFIRLSPLSRIEGFLLSDNFHRLIIYSIFILGVNIIRINIVQFFLDILSILLMFFLGLLYEKSIKVIIEKRKKFNNFAFQYIISVFLISFILLKSYIF